MSTGLRFFSISALLLGAGSLVWGVAAGFRPTAGTHREEAAAAAPIADAPLEPYRARLLDVAFEAASAMPLMPHVKTRSQAQEDVAVAWLELDQPRRAQSAVDKIENWRRGIGQADLAFYCAQKGNEHEARRHLANAIMMTDTMATEAYMQAADDGIEGAQAWRRDRIRAKIARTQLLLGEKEKAAATARDLEPSEAGPVEAMRAKLAGAGALEEQIAALRNAAKSSLEAIQNAIACGLEVYRAVYPDQDARLRLEQELEACVQRAPATVRIDLYARLVECALSHADAEKALELVGDAHFAAEGIDWLPEERIPIAVRLAVLRHRAGDEEKARAELDAAQESFEAHLGEIADFVRADVLRPIAEAYVATGDRATALTVHARALEEGARNPNAVPRAADLAATLASMALHACEPDEALWQRIIKIRSDLREPW